MDVWLLIVCSYSATIYFIDGTLGSGYEQGSDNQAQGCFTEPDYNYPGYDLGAPVIQTDSKACRGSANGVANAQFWTFRFSDRFCWLKSSNRNRVAEGTGVLISGNTGCTEGCFTEPDYNYPGFDLGAPVIEADWKACRDSATRAANAHFWTFRFSDRFCWLKSSNRNRVAEGRGILISGEAGCREAVNGAWGDWSGWSACTKTCGGGRRQRIRSCNNPRPSNGGRECSGRFTDKELCNKQECVQTINGVWGDWSWWSSCSKTCDIGIRRRTRSCNNPRPSNGGKECNGRYNDSDQCNTKECAVNGAWGDWHRWSSCSNTCGGGRRKRTRRCNNPRPFNGGRKCRGRYTDNQQCNTQECVYGHWHGHGHGHLSYEHEAYGHLQGHGDRHGSYEYGDSAETYEDRYEDKGEVDYIADSAETED